MPVGLLLTTTLIISCNLMGIVHSTVGFIHILVCDIATADGHRQLELKSLYIARHYLYPHLCLFICLLVCLV